MYKHIVVVFNNQRPQFYILINWLSMYIDSDCIQPYMKITKGLSPVSRDSMI